MEPDTLSKLIETVCNAYNLKPGTITPETKILNLGDSLEAFQLAMDVEDKFGIIIDDDELLAGITVRQMADIVDRELNRKKAK